MDKRHWTEGDLSLAKGNIVQHTIFHKEGENSPASNLRYIESYSHGSLVAGTRSLAHVNEGIQEVFFILNGTGILSTPYGEHSISEGDGILMPPGIEHTIINNGNITLEFLLVVESIGDKSVVKATKPLVRNYRESVMSINHWSYLGYRIFDGEDGFNELGYVGVVLIDPLRTGDNHSHGPDFDEVWYMWRGQVVHIVSQEVCIQREGTAISVCPCHPGHTIINVSNEQVYFVYFSSVNRNDSG